MGLVALAVWVLAVALIAARIGLLHIQGLHPLRFGNEDKRNWAIIPFALFYAYVIVSGAFALPHMGTVLFRSEAVSLLGIIVCTLALGMLAWSLISFGQSFRVGIDSDQPGKLVTSGVFALSRNPMYTALDAILVGVFLISPNWILLLFVILGFWMYNREIQHEETALQKIYGAQYREYRQKVRRYL
ncbi:MAG: isoprenylcysteine carboxylmethyltransferase family protein [Sulfobacillus acidophilus]|uniref:Isoprenylcysteine carboxylmethyltransferase family protein n=1 Tax=Sulfobacillus acidophilus TaxID=53633 RepID=A0A2T2WGH8_9FIRM|nr:MAG: isoprenylcysteine carboxylmethyltransferase family protein [Sulfobacillus acidophilus]